MLNTPITSEGQCVTSWECWWWCACPALNSRLYLQYSANGLRGCCLCWLVWKCLIWDDEKAIAISRPWFVLPELGRLRQWQLPITSAYKEQTIRPRPVTTSSPTSPDLCNGPTSEHLQVNRQWYCVKQQLGAEVNQTTTTHITCTQLIILTTKARSRRGGKRGNSNFFISVEEVISVGSQVLIKYVQAVTVFKV